MNSDTSKPSLASVIAFLFGMLLICLCIYELSKDDTPVTTPKQTTTQLNQHVIVDTVWHYRIVKSVKVDNQTSTSYHYKYDWLHSKFRQQPRIESETKYYIVYKDGGIEETTKEKGMFYEKGDTIKSYSFVYKK
jgi:hypothetical protein